MQGLIDNMPVLVVLSMTGVFVLVSSFVIFLFRNQKRLAEQKNKQQAARLEQQQQLLHAVIESQESERTNIGRDLHDDVGTALSNLRMIIERMAPATSHDASLKKLGVSGKALIDTIITDLRNISHRLSPEILTMQSLTDAIEELCIIVNGTAGVEVTLSNDATRLLDTADLTTALAIYRILEELTTNTIKHAAATRIDISITAEEDLLVIDYRDNGKGMPSTTEHGKGRGLQNIESRLLIIHASQTLISASGTGFHLRLKIPVGHN